MRAVALDFQSRSLVEADVPEPVPAPDRVLFKVVAAGVCGTDRDLAQFRFGTPPEGETRLILGHEALGRVVESGDAGFQPGDWVVPQVRRSCMPACRSCGSGRRDLCISGKYTERGIFGAHGYFTDYALDSGADLLHVPESLVDVAVLAEPLSVVEKAVAVALRTHLGEPETAVVIGAGTIGLLAAMTLRERSLRVTVVSVEPADSTRAALVRDAGFEYRNRADRPADIVIEAAGAPEAASAGLAALAPLGVMVLLGAPHAPEGFPLLDMIVSNQVVAGSVNAGPEHWSAGLSDLARFDPSVLRRMIHREPFDTFRESITGPPPRWPKVVHVLD